MTDRLYRSPTERVIAGVAGGMAVWLNIDPSLVRLVWVLLAIFSGGIFILVYILMMIVVPLPPAGWVPQRAPGGPAPSWGAGWGSDPGASGGAVPASGAAAPTSGVAETTSGAAPDESSGSASPPPAPGASSGGWTSPPPAAAGGAWSSGAAGTSGGAGSSGGRGAGIVVGAVLILIGVWFLVGRYVEVDWDTVWPIALVVLGLGFMVASIRRSPPGVGG